MKIILFNKVVVGMKVGIEIQDFTKISQRGQLVIPKEIRDGLHIKGGDVLVTALVDDVILIKKVKPKITEEDLRLLKEANEAWEEIERGEYESMEAKEFFKEIKKW